MNHQQPPYGQGQGYPPQQPPAGTAQGYYAQPGQPQPPQQHQQYPGYGQPPPPGQYQGQPPYGAPPAQGQYPPPVQQPGGAPQYAQQPGQAPAYGQPPPGAPQYPPATGAPPYQQQQAYPPQQYGAPGYQAPPPQQYGAPQQPPQQYGAPPPQQWQQYPQGPPQGAPGYGYAVPPTPASLGYDPAQQAMQQRVDTNADAESLRKAMKGMGCDEKALIRVLTSPKYANPFAMAQLVRDYNSRFMRELAKDIESETRGDLETALLALIRGPLENDARTLEKALNRAGTDEDALNDVLLCRSNADLRAISAEYKKIFHRDLLAVIKDDVDDTLFRMYSMVLSATRAEDATPVVAAEIDHKVTEVHRATEGTIGANAVAVAQIFVSSNDAQLHALSEAYQRKYHRSLEDVIEKEFRGDMEDALLRMLYSGLNRAKADAERVVQPLRKTVRKDRLFINRVLSLYWDRNRLDAAKTAYKNRYGTTMKKEFKDVLSGDYEALMIALIGEK